MPRPTMSLGISLGLGRRRCPHCGSRRVVRSHRSNLLETLLSLLLLLRPFRCLDCNDRHYAFFFRQRLPVEPAPAAETTKPETPADS